MARFTVFLGQLDQGDEVELYTAGGHKIKGVFHSINEMGILQMEIKMDTKSRDLQIYVDDIIAVSK